MSSSTDPRDAELLAEALERIAHQIKNPLQAVAMNVEVLRMRVRKEAPELWDELERFADATDENVGLLDRRLRLLLALGRRSTDDPPVSVDLPALLRDFAGALRLDDEPPALRVEAGGPAVAAGARPGFVLALVLELHAHVALEEPGREELVLAVRASDGEVRLEADVTGPLRERWRELARDGGGRLEGGDGDGLSLVLPRG